MAGPAVTPTLEQRLAAMEEEIRASKEEARISKEQLGQMTIENAKLKRQLDTSKSKRRSYRDSSDDGSERPSPLRKKRLNFDDRDADRDTDTTDKNDEDYHYQPEDEETESTYVGEESDGSSDDYDMMRGHRILHKERGTRGDAERMMKEIKKLKEQVRKRADVKTASIRESIVKYMDDPFVAWISNTRMPKKFTMPHCKRFEGNADPEEHVMSYKHIMSTCNVPPEDYEAVLCKAFSASLGGAAQRWYASLAPNSVRSFSNFMRKFINHFSHNKKMEVDEADLYDCRQKKGETLRKYLQRFNDVKIAVPNCKERVAVKAFVKGLIPDTKLHIDLMSETPRTFTEVRRKAEGAMVYEEDLARRKGTDRKDNSGSNTQRQPSRRDRSPLPARRNNDSARRGTREVKSDNARTDHPARTAQPARDRRQYEFIPYDLAVPPKEIVSVLKGMGGSVRFPDKLPPGTPKDMSRYCDFHEDHGHTTDQCYALRKEVAHLLKQGSLKEFLTQRKGDPGTGRANSKSTGGSSSTTAYNPHHQCNHGGFGVERVHYVSC